MMIKKIPSEMEAAPCYILFTLFVLVKLLKIVSTVVCMTIYIVRKG